MTVVGLRCVGAWGVVAAALIALAGCGAPRHYEERGSIKDTVAAPKPVKAAAKARATTAKRKPVRAKPRASSAAKPRPKAMAAPAIATPKSSASERMAMTVAPVTAEPPAPPRTAPPSRPALPVGPPPSIPPPAAEPAAPAAPAPAAPRQVAPKQAAPDGANGTRLLAEGRALFQTGEVLAAREKYVAALTAPLPDVLLELARTYDPNYLDRLPKSDADADVDRARALYEQAAALGAPGAQEDLQRLQGR